MPCCRAGARRRARLSWPPPASTLPHAPTACITTAAAAPTAAAMLQDVQRNLDPKNRDKFTQQVTIVRHEFKSK